MPTTPDAQPTPSALARYDAWQARLALNPAAHQARRAYLEARAPHVGETYRAFLAEQGRDPELYALWLAWMRGARIAPAREGRP